MIEFARYFEELQIREGNVNCVFRYDPNVFGNREQVIIIIHSKPIKGHGWAREDCCRDLIHGSAAVKRCVDCRWLVVTMLKRFAKSLSQDCVTRDPFAFASFTLGCSGQSDERLRRIALGKVQTIQA